MNRFRPDAWAGDRLARVVGNAGRSADDVAQSLAEALSRGALNVGAAKARSQFGR